MRSSKNRLNSNAIKHNKEVLWSSEEIFMSCDAIVRRERNWKLIKFIAFLLAFERRWNETRNPCESWSWNSFVVFCKHFLRVAPWLCVFAACEFATWNMSRLWVAEKKTSCGYENEKNRKKMWVKSISSGCRCFFYWPFFVFVSRHRARVGSKFSARWLKIQFHVF